MEVLDCVVVFTVMLTNIAEVGKRCADPIFIRPSANRFVAALDLFSQREALLRKDLRSFVITLVDE